MKKFIRDVLTQLLQPARDIKRLLAFLWAARNTNVVWNENQVADYVWALWYAAPMVYFFAASLQSNRQLILAAVRYALEVGKYGCVLQHASHRLRGDRDFVIEVVKINGYELEFASQELKEDRDVLVEVVKQNGHALGCISPNSQFRSDRGLALMAVENNGFAFIVLPRHLQADHEIIRAATATNRHCFKRAPHLRGDEECVLQAVRNDAQALSLATPELQRNRIFVLEAVKRNNEALKYVVPELLNDRSFVLDVIRASPTALRYANNTYKHDPKLFDDAFKDSDGIETIMSNMLIDQEFLECKDKAKYSPFKCQNIKYLDKLFENDTVYTALAKPKDHGEQHHSDAISEVRKHLSLKDAVMLREVRGFNLFFEQPLQETNQYENCP